MAQSSQNLSHKTVFVLDHGHHFSKPSGIVVDYDMSSKNRTPGFIPLHPLSKSIWTWSVECTLEYCRMVYDIFPTGKHISLIASDVAAIVLNTWMKEHQNLPTLMEALAKLGSPDQTEKEGGDIMFGLTEAISALTRCTNEQHQARTSLDGSEVVNRGRIICITSLSSPADAGQIINRFRAALINGNKIAAASDELMPIQECELEVIDLHPLSSQPVLTSSQVHGFEGLLCEIGSYKVGKTLASKMLALVQKHFDLATTTITGIPMKEEQNAGSSANYDVGILHCKKAHDEILCIQRMGVATDLKSASAALLSSATPSTAPDKSGLVVLKWCQPRLSVSDLLYSTAAYRISAVDVNSRPSLCLTNFLLNGRQVILEQPRRTGAKVVTHMLASHGGEIFIHCLGMNRSPLEDPPSISEGPGGRVTDYRIKDFGAFMRRNRLAPCQEIDCEDESLPVERAKQQLERMTRNYPMTIGETVLYNLHNCIDPLMETIFKPSLSEVDKMKCREIIYTIVKMEANNEPLPVPTMTTVRKGNKRDEQYRQLWSELEALVQSAADMSPGHEEILECIYRCRTPASGELTRKTDKAAVKTEPKEEPDQSTKLPSETSTSETTSAVADIFSPESPPANKKPNLDFTGSFAKPTGGGQSLLSLWTDRLKSIHSRKHEEFAGRAESYGAIATLYPNLKLEPKEKPINTGNTKPLSGKAS